MAIKYNVYVTVSHAILLHTSDFTFIDGIREYTTSDRTTCSWFACQANHEYVVVSHAKQTMNKSLYLM